MGKKQKKIEKIMQRPSRSFHPAVRLMKNADGELSLLVNLANHYGIEFNEHRGEGFNFISAASRKAREPRNLHVFARYETEDAKKIDMRIGMALDFYDPKQRHEPYLRVVIWRRLSEPVWHLDLQRLFGLRRKLGEETLHALRRFGLGQVKHRELNQHDLFDVAFAMAKDYKEQILIPREMREKARK